MNIKIEHGIPIAKWSQQGLYVHLFRKMKKGDSFLIPERKRNNALISAMRNDFKAVSRKVGGGMVRVWRVK